MVPMYSTFFCGRAEDDDLATQVTAGQHLGRGQGSCHRGAGYQVVAARMADVFERIWWYFTQQISSLISLPSLSGPEAKRGNR